MKEECPPTNPNFNPLSLPGAIKRILCLHQREHTFLKNCNKSRGCFDPKLCTSAADEPAVHKRSAARMQRPFRCYRCMIIIALTLLFPFGLKFPILRWVRKKEANYGPPPHSS